MVRLLKTLIVVLIVLIIAFVVIGLMLPTNFLVSRSIVIDAPASKIHSNLNDLNKWPEWSPWEENDPNLEVTMEISPPVSVQRSPGSVKTVMVHLFSHQATLQKG